MEQHVDIAVLQDFFVHQGVWIRPFGCLLYIMPPYCISPDELGLLTQALVKAAALAGQGT
jgi:adenosylmethionine---8-amino-7-oxononanoate aminotransferase